MLVLPLPLLPVPWFSLPPAIATVSVIFVVVALLSLRLLIFPNYLPAQVSEAFVDIGSPSSTCLIIRCISPRLTDSECASAAHGAVVFEIALIADKDDRHMFVIFYAHDLFAEVGEFL